MLRAVVLVDKQHAWPFAALRLVHGQAVAEVELSGGLERGSVGNRLPAGEQHVRDGDDVTINHQADLNIARAKVRSGRIDATVPHTVARRVPKAEQRLARFRPWHGVASETSAAPVGFVPFDV